MRPPIFGRTLDPKKVNSLREQAHALLRQLDYLSSRHTDGIFHPFAVKDFEKIVGSLKANISARDRLSDLLQQQIDVLTAGKEAYHPFEEMLVPGKILQNETRVDWEAMRKQFGILLDRPVGEYYRQINDLLDIPIVLAEKQEITYRTALTFYPENDPMEYPIEQLNSLEQSLNKKGFCRNLPLNLLFNKFYWSHFCRISIADLTLSRRLYNVLKLNNLHTIGDIVIQSEQRLSGTRFFGYAMIEELLRLLFAMGLKLGMTDSDFRVLYGIHP